MSPARMEVRAEAEHGDRMVENKLRNGHEETGAPGKQSDQEAEREKAKRDGGNETRVGEMSGVRRSSGM